MFVFLHWLWYALLVAATASLPEQSRWEPVSFFSLSFDDRQRVARFGMNRCEVSQHTINVAESTMHGCERQSNIIHVERPRVKGAISASVGHAHAHPSSGRMIPSAHPDEATFLRIRREPPGHWTHLRIHPTALGGEDVLDDE